MSTDHMSITDLLFNLPPAVVIDLLIVFAYTKHRSICPDVCTLTLYHFLQSVLIFSFVFVSILLFRLTIDEKKRQVCLFVHCAARWLKQSQVNLEAQLKQKDEF